MEKKKTLVLGASENPDRYSNMALYRLKAAGHPVVAVGNRSGEAYGIPIHKGPVEDSDIHTITIYLSPENQKPYYDYILSLKPKRIIFNPGTYNPELIRMAESKGIHCEIACNLVLLSTGQY
ncbi:MAG: CoA-binding protein [Thermaurantimonas sp.]|uniref:CoA-binding protein n=1 Tax=Thermaurantimonas sp. TaxID=2681568 RepID=UPI0039189CF3